MKKGQIIKKNRVNKIGRPSVIDDTKIRKLLSAYRLGATDEIACQYAGISLTALYENKKRNIEFQQEIDQYKHLIRKDAVKLIYRKIKENDVESAKWWLERKYPNEFSTNARSIVAIDNRSVNQYIEFTQDDTIIDERKKL